MLIVIFSMIIFFLLLPIKYVIDIKINNGIKIKFRVSYLFGLVKFDSTKKKLKDKSGKKSSVISKLNKKNSNGENKFDIKFLSIIFKFISELIKKLRPQKIIINGQIGFDDPCYTGYACALENIFGIRTNIKYNFEQEIFDLHLYFRTQICALFFLLFMLKYIFAFIKCNFFEVI